MAVILYLDKVKHSNWLDLKWVPISNNKHRYYDTIC